MTIKEIIFSTLQDKFAKENIHKLLIKKDLINSITTLEVSFSDGRADMNIKPNFSEKKTLDLLLINKVKQAIKKQDKQEISTLYIYINLTNEEINLCYSHMDNDKIILFNN